MYILNLKCLSIYQSVKNSIKFLLEHFTKVDTGNVIKNMGKHRIFTTSFASVYPHYVVKVEKKGRTKAEVDHIICWLTGYDQQALQEQIDSKTDFETFFEQAPQLNPNATKITGVICGYRVEEIEDKLMQKIRFMDKMIDELAKGKAMEKILRK